MKTMKKLIAISLTVVMLFALAVPAVAHVWYSEEQNTTGFINEDKEIVINAGKLPAGATVELGASDSDWKYAYPYILDRDFTGGLYNGAIDADVYVMYDETNIYIKEVRRDTIKSGDVSIYRFILPEKALSVGTKTPAGAYITINFNADATETAVANTVADAQTLSYAWSDDNTLKAGSYLGYSEFKSAVTSLAVKEGDAFVVETSIPWAKIGDGTALDYDYIGFKHRVTTNGGTGSAYHQMTSLANVGSPNHSAGAKTYHNDWDNFAPMYLRTYVDENAANTKPDLSWYNDTDTEFTITTAEQLRGLAYLVNQKATLDEAKAVTAGKTFKLGANIDLNPHWEESDGTAPYQLWLPIGAFAGTFDGQGYAIDDMICKPFYNISAMTGKSYDSWERNMGFIAHGFGNITIKNLTITDADVEATFCAAGLIAVVFDQSATVNISNVYVDADVLSVPLKYTCSTSHTHAASCYGHTNIFAGILMGRCLSKAENWATVENAVCLGNLAINKRSGTGATGSGPVWGTSSSSSAKIDNVLVSLETNTINLVGIDLTTLKDTTTATGETYRTKYIANSGTWTETNSVNVASNGAMNNTAGAVTAYPESWVKADEDSILEMPVPVAEMVSRNLWIQETAVDTATNTFSVRILTGIDTLEWDALGLKIEMKVGDADFVEITDVANVTNVYTTILAVGAEVNASDLNGAKYVGGVVLTGISATETVTFKVTPIKYVGETAYANAHASTVTYVNGVIQK